MVRSGTTDITDELDDLVAPRGYHVRALTDEMFEIETLQGHVAYRGDASKVRRWLCDKRIRFQHATRP
jgi:hypothetical protein